VYALGVPVEDVEDDEDELLLPHPNTIAVTAA
jgi:hypothetical protein